MTTTIDHLVFACPDIEATSRWFSETVGVTPAIGGQHPGVGTRNALLSLGERTYLELIGPDPDQPAPSHSRPFGVDDLLSPSLRGWAAAPDDLTKAVVEARRQGLAVGPPMEGRRLTRTGREMSWRMAELEHATAGPSDQRRGAPEPDVFPFYIDWGKTAHPAATSPGGLTLERLVLLTPAAGPVTGLLDALGLEGPWDVEASPAPGLRAVIAGHKGNRITLAS
jgi:hypothetical protein